MGENAPFKANLSTSPPTSLYFTNTLCSRYISLPQPLLYLPFSPPYISRSLFQLALHTLPPRRNLPAQNLIIPSPLSLHLLRNSKLRNGALLDRRLPAEAVLGPPPQLHRLHPGGAVLRVPDLALLRHAVDLVGAEGAARLRPEDELVALCH